jgi:GAF domain-containing protein
VPTTPICKPASKTSLAWLPAVSGCLSCWPKWPRSQCARYRAPMVLERRTVRSGSLGGEKMWPRFGPRVGRLGVHSALSLPLLLPDRVVGAINVYAHGKDVFDEHAAELGELFAKPAAVAVHNAQILADALALTAQLQTALSTRPVIDQAIGLIRGRTGRSVEDAFAHLRAMSQTEHRKLADVAQQIVDEAVRRARARHRPTE